MAAPEDVFYDGFRTFAWLAELVGLQLDQVNFVITQFTALVLAALLRSAFSPLAVSPATRHAFGLVIGLALGYFTFGQQAAHLAGLPALCYVAMRTQDPHHMQRVVFAIALVYLSCIHCHRQMYDYSSYTLDITGPLMVITQKVTSLAFSVHDGLTRKQDELTPSQRYHAVHNIPSILEYFSYIFHFQTLMAGPIIFYRDYTDFIHGSSQKLLKGPSEGQNGHTHRIVIEPSPAVVVVKKVVASLICGIIFVTLIPSYPIQKISEDEFIKDTSMVYKYWYLMIATMIIRFKYYHAWLFADAICNNSGLGFNGYNSDGSARWDLVSNVDAVKFETASSLRDAIEYWNVGTNRWLRQIVYERVDNHKLLRTYALSAIWHGFYPGYYLTFANAAFFTLVSRKVRRFVRPHFLTSNTKKVFYDTLTTVTTRIVLAYITFSFVALEIGPSINMYLHLYLAPHFLGLAGLFLLPLIPRPAIGSNLASNTNSSSGTPELEIVKPHRTVTNGFMHK